MTTPSDLAPRDPCAIHLACWETDYKIRGIVQDVSDDGITIGVKQGETDFLESACIGEQIWLTTFPGGGSTVLKGSIRRVDLPQRTVEISVKETMEQVENQRSFFRVADTLRLTCRRLTSGEAEALRTRLARAPASAQGFSSRINDISGRVSALKLPFAKERVYLDMLKLLDQMDRRIAALESGMAEGDPGQPPVDVCLSGSGISFPTTEAYEADEFVQITLHLESEVTTRVEALGRIVSCIITGQQSYHAALHFVFIHEADREAVVRHTIARQRAILREMRSV